MHGMLLGQGSPPGSYPWGETMLGLEEPATPVTAISLPCFCACSVPGIARQV
jgi:hypothetical protein